MSHRSKKSSVRNRTRLAMVAALYKTSQEISVSCTQLLVLLYTSTLCFRNCLNLLDHSTAVAGEADRPSNLWISTIHNWSILNCNYAIEGDTCSTLLDPHTWIFSRKMCQNVFSKCWYFDKIIPKQGNFKRKIQENIGNCSIFPSKKAFFKAFLRDMYPF